MNEPVRLIDNRRVDKLRILAAGPSVAAMDMAKHLKPRLNLFDSLRQFLAAQVSGGRVRFVKHAEWWSMSHQDICIRRDHLPIAPNRRAASDVESPIVEFRLNWRSPDLQTRHFRA